MTKKTLFGNPSGKLEDWKHEVYQRLEVCSAKGENLYNNAIIFWCDKHRENVGINAIVFLFQVTLIVVAAFIFNFKREKLQNFYIKYSIFNSKVFDILAQEPSSKYDIKFLHLSLKKWRNVKTYL